LDGNTGPLFQFDSKHIVKYISEAINLLASQIKNMPITKSAKKKVRQERRHEERNKAIRSRVKTYMKKMVVLSKTDPEGAKKLLPEAYSVMDTACKKHMIHKNNADRKKSLLARLVAKAGEASSKKEAVKA
jgi:small subunit ribosomal protein S20